MDVLFFGPFRFDRASYRLTRENADHTDEQILLRPKAFDLLRHLAEHAGRVISPDEFMTALWPGTYVQPEVLKKHISAVRKALGDRATPSRFIETVRGRGYRFIAEVRTSAAVQPAVLTAPDTLVGRSAARSELETSLQRARAGEMQIVFLTGEAGIGKTALAQAFAEAVSKNDATVVTTHCLPGSGEADAYYPVLELLTELSRGPARGRLAAILEEVAPTWLVQLPGLRAANHAQLRSDVVGATAHRMAREFCQALDALARDEFVLFVLEDIHWADQATLDLIQVVANRRPRAKLLIVATLRTPGPTEAAYAAALAQRCSLYRVAREIKLAPLAVADVEAFLEGLAPAKPPAPLVSHLFKRSEGNPLFLRAIFDQLVQQNLVAWDETNWRLDAQFERLSSRAPPDLKPIIEAEIRSLSPQAQDVLEAASLSVGPFSARLYYVASDLEEQAFEDVCESLARCGRLVRRGEGVETWDGGVGQTYCFRHALFQQVAYERQGSKQRAARHSAAAQHIGELFSADPTPASSILAHHFLHAVEAMAYEFVGDTAAAPRHRHAQAAAVNQLAAGLPPGHPARETLKSAQLRGPAHSTGSRRPRLLSIGR